MYWPEFIFLRGSVFATLIFFVLFPDQRKLFAISNKSVYKKSSERILKFPFLVNFFKKIKSRQISNKYHFINDT